MKDEETWLNICLILEDMTHNHFFWCWFMNENGLVLLMMKKDMFRKEFLRKVTVTIDCTPVTINCHAQNFNFHVKNS